MSRPGSGGAQHLGWAWELTSPGAWWRRAPARPCAAVASNPELLDRPRQRRHQPIKSSLVISGRSGPRWTAPVIGRLLRANTKLGGAMIVPTERAAQGDRTTAGCRHRCHGQWRMLSRGLVAPWFHRVGDRHPDQPAKAVQRLFGDLGVRPLPPSASILRVGASRSP